MLGVPPQDSTDEIPLEIAVSTKVRVSLSEVLNLVETVRAELGDRVRVEDVDGEIVIKKIDPPTRLALQIPIGYGAAVVAIGVVGWFGWSHRSQLFGSSLRGGHYRAATLEEAHQYLAKNSVDPSLLIENRPYATVSDESSELDFSPKKRLSEDDMPASSPIRPQIERGFNPMPPPMEGSISATLPDPAQMRMRKVQAPAEQAPPVDIHDLETRLRGTIRENGGRLERVSEEPGDGAKIFYVGVPADQSASFMDAIHDEMGRAATVSSLGSSEGRRQGTEADVSSEETNLAALRKQLDQAEISFLPQAPVLQSLRAQYADELARVAAARKAAHPETTVRIEISSRP